MKRRHVRARQFRKWRKSMARIQDVDFHVLHRSANKHLFQQNCCRY